QPVSGITDNQGRLRVFITNTKAGSEDYTFSINDSSVTRQLVFKPDESTATMTDSQLKIVDDDQKADGTAVNRVQATVLDAYGNRIPGYSVQFIADNDAVPPQSQLTTDSNGETIFELTNTNAGKTKVTAQVNGKTAFVNVTFTADSATAEILDGNMTVPVNNKPADGVAQNTVKVIVTDSKGNLVPSVSVTFSTDPAATPAGETSLTNEKGEAFFSLSSTVATDIMVTAKVNDNTMSKPATFVPGSAVPSMSLIRTDQETYIAGSDLTVTVTLKDGQGNGISGQGALLTEKAVIVPNAAAKAGSAWTEKGDGEYERVYTAEKSGTNLKASLKPDSWSSAVHSSVYAITAGSVAQTTSQVITDKQNYTAGKDIKVTVMLKDTYGNSVTGQVSSLTAQTVIVPNTGEKAGSDWSDRNDGSYERNYTAKNESADNKVSVKLDGWTTASESAAYSITIGGVEQSASGVRVDKGTYTAGDDIKVTVTLKDGQGNGIRGQEVALLTEKAVIVPNTAEKADVWTYQGDGEYERVYTAQKASSGNKVSLKLDDWGSAAESGVYAVTQGSVVQADSAIERDKSTYTAGDDIRVTVTLKDGQGNGVTGQKDVLTADTVTVPNAAVKAGDWDDKGNGEYERVYTAQTVSAGNKASLKLNGWGSAAESDVYAVAQGSIVEGGSAIERDKDTYTAGDDIKVTVTLKDGQGNGVTGQKDVLTADTVTVPNAAVKAGDWDDKGNGEYERVYTAQTVSAGNKASLKLNGWGSEAESDVYAVTPDSANPDTGQSSLSADPMTIVANDDDESTLTFILKDKFGNNIPSQDVKFKSDLTDSKVSTTTKNPDGTYSAVLKGTKAGNANITIDLDGQAFAVVPVTVTLTSDIATAEIEDVSLSGVQERKIANGTDFFEFIAEVRDANDNPVSGVTILWTNTAGASATFSETSQQTDAEGKVKVKLISTKTPVYDIVVSAEQGSQSVNADQKVSFEELFTTSVLVIDAVKPGDSPVKGANVKIFSEDGSELLHEITTDATGKFKVDLVGGKYAIKITADNYDDYDDFMVVKSGADTNFKFALSPSLDTKFGRIILQWSEAPQDLDAHLLVPPVGGGARIHVYYPTSAQNPAGADASLDKDQKAAPGVETITIEKGHTGTYTYYVKNFSGPAAKLSTAKVLLFLNPDLTLKPGTSRMMSFNAPDVNVAKSSQWIVFDIIVDANNDVQVVQKGTVSSAEPK
ncbi:Ig-like domain-containing protein, partial [Morganella sp. GD04133]|uniref:Ig-like domain-containing protein n=1 Tax=Morganella sp. GD04133 TaxID=2975435 RepID=UPI00244B532B